MLDMVHSIIFALKRQPKKIYPELVSLLCDQLCLFLTAHESIRVLLRYAYNESKYPIVADAVSLTREQVEKVFVVALLIDNPRKWIKQYLRNSWRKDYEEILLEMEEHSSNLRYQEHLNKRAPEYLKKTRRPARPDGKGFETIVSELAMRVVKYSFQNPGGPKPTWLKRKGSVRDYLTDYFEFPTPGRAAAKIRDSRHRKYLYRWHKEYQYLCEYTHVALGKMILQSGSERKDMKSA